MKNVSPAQKLQELPVGSIIAEKDAENVFFRLNSGWVPLADLKTSLVVKSQVNVLMFYATVTTTTVTIR